MYCAEAALGSCFMLLLAIPHDCNLVMVGHARLIYWVRLSLCLVEPVATLGDLTRRQLRLEITNGHRLCLMSLQNSLDHSKLASNAGLLFFHLSHFVLTHVLVPLNYPLDFPKELQVRGRISPSYVELFNYQRVFKIGPMHFIVATSYLGSLELNLQPNR